MKNLFFTAFVLTITNFLGIKTLAQKDISPYVVNEFIGDTLSHEERDYYQLFSKIDGFQCAVFYLNPDSSLNANVQYVSNGVLSDTLIENYKNLKSLRYHIYARNALENGTLDTFHPVYESSEYKRGSEVCAYMSDGIENSGELLLVRESSILILKPDCDENLNNPDCVFHGKASDIEKLVIKGNSNLGWGIGLGLLTSVVVAGVIYQANYHSSSFGPGIDEKTAVSIGVAAAGCVIIGTVIGILTSTPDEVIEPFSEYEISGLSTHSRYQSNEPNELKRIK
jgi:hypothetical protein